MTDLYAIAFKLCMAALIPNPHTVFNLPEHQQKYIMEAAQEVCRKETAAERMFMCVEKNFIPEEC